jgi:general stress protein 26
MTMPQGDVRLLGEPVAVRLLTSTELARVAYQAKDGTPRVLPMLFHWTGEELVVPTFAISHKVASLRHHPRIAVTIDTAGPPPEVLLLRGAVSVTIVDGVLDEYAAAQRRYYPGPQAESALAELEQSTPQMARISLRPDWVGLLDFRTRFPGQLNAATAGS